MVEDEESFKSVFKAASALAGGVARQGETCGALTGAILALGTVVGRERMEDIKQFRSAMDPATKIYEAFKERIGDTLCKEIMIIRYGRSFRLDDPEDVKAFREAGGNDANGCPEICGIAARIAAEVILENMEKG